MLPINHKQWWLLVGCTFEYALQTLTLESSCSRRRTTTCLWSWRTNLGWRSRRRCDSGFTLHGAHLALQLWRWMHWGTTAASTTNSTHGYNFVSSFWFLHCLPLSGTERARENNEERGNCNQYHMQHISCMCSESFSQFPCVFLVWCMHTKRQAKPTRIVGVTLLPLKTLCVHQSAS